MTVGKLEGQNLAYNSLYSTISKQMAKSKANILIFDTNKDGKLSMSELNVAKEKLPTMLVSDIGDVQFTKLNKKGKVVGREQYNAENGDFISSSSYEYDSKGRQSKIVNKDSSGMISTTTYSYHKNGNLSQERFVAGDDVIVFDYDNKGNLKP